MELSLVAQTVIVLYFFKTVKKCRSNCYFGFWAGIIRMAVTRSRESKKSMVMLKEGNESVFKNKSVGIFDQRWT